MKTKSEIRSEDSAEYRKDIVGWICTVCKRYWGTDKHMAEYCCATSMPCECGGRKHPGYTCCDRCIAKHNAERDQKKLNNAKTVEYDGPFMVGDKYYQTEEEYIEDCEQDEIEPMEFVFVPIISRVFELDIDDLINREIERSECDEYCDFDPVGCEELKAAIKKFNETNKGILVYFEGSKEKFRIE